MIFGTDGLLDLHSTILELSNDVKRSSVLISAVLPLHASADFSEQGGTIEGWRPKIVKSGTVRFFDSAFLNAC